MRIPRLLLIVGVEDVGTRRGAIEAGLAAGVDAVQLRDPRAAGGALLETAHVLRAFTRTAGALLLVNDRIDVALAAGADGVHLPAASFPTAVARALVGPGLLIGRSTHAPADAVAAATDGADYVVLGPVFATPSKERFGPPLGVAAIAAAHVSVPLLAIGGITSERVDEVRRAGASGVAVIRAILDADDPRMATTRLVTAFDG